MFDVHEIEAGFIGDAGRTLKVIDGLTDLSVCKQRVVVSDTKALVEDWMVIEDPWLGSIVTVGTAITA
jgi:hypothetical protein